jgi:formate hydrogenlyase subunit 4
MRYLFIALQLVVLIAVSPLITGLIKKMKNFMRLRKGPGVFQPYYDSLSLPGRRRSCPAIRRGYSPSLLTRRSVP